jgi:hypothetical protein
MMQSLSDVWAEEWIFLFFFLLLSLFLFVVTVRSTRQTLLEVGYHRLVLGFWKCYRSFRSSSIIYHR